MADSTATAIDTQQHAPQAAALQSPDLADDFGSKGGERLEGQLFIALIGAVLLVCSAIATAIGMHSDLASLPSFAAAILLAIPIVWQAFKELRQGKPSSSSLAAIAVVAAISIGHFAAAGFLALFLWMADLILSRTAWGAQRAIRELIGLTPDIARLVEPGGDEREVSLRQVKVGDVVRVRPGENLPVDGRIIRGESDINQASLTGEAVPITAQRGTDVYAGTTNLTGQIDVEVTAIAGDTTIGKVEQLIREAESAKSAKQEIVEQLAAYYVPVVLMVALLVWFFTAKGNPETRDEAMVRAITVLVVTCPGALLIAHPTAMVAAFAAAARLGIMIKQTRTLEAAATVDTVIMDKTGTLTTGKFAVSRLAPAEGADGAALLQAAADGEQHSNHPLAKSILDTARQARINAAPIEKYEEIHGRGVIAHAPEGKIHVGRSSWLLELNPAIEGAVQKVEEKIEGMSGVHVMKNGRYLGAVGLEDKLRRNAPEVVSDLRKIGVRRVCIFTGDKLSVAKRVAQAVGVDAIEAECHPEEKHDELKYLLAKGHRCLVVGDGINDGPILASADVGVAMGLSGTDIATNSAGVALMNDDLRHIPFLVELANKTRAVIAQNIGFSIALAIVGLALAATGNISIWIVPLYYALGYVFVIANSLRLVRYGEGFQEAEDLRRQMDATRVAKPVRAAGASATLQPTG